MAKLDDLTERELDLIEVSLESAISVCGVSFGGHDDDLEKLQQEYNETLAKVRRARE